MVPPPSKRPRSIQVVLPLNGLWIVPKEKKKERDKWVHMGTHHKGSQSSTMLLCQSCSHFPFAGCLSLTRQWIQPLCFFQLPLWNHRIEICVTSARDCQPNCHVYTYFLHTSTCHCLLMHLCALYRQTWVCPFMQRVLHILSMDWYPQISIYFVYHMQLHTWAHQHFIYCPLWIWYYLGKINLQLFSSSVILWCPGRAPLYLNIVNTCKGICKCIYEHTHSFCSAAQSHAAWTICKQISYLLKPWSNRKHKTKEVVFTLWYNLLLFTCVCVFMHVFYTFFWFALLQRHYYNFGLMSTCKLSSCKNQCVTANISSCRFLDFIIYFRYQNIFKVSFLSKDGSRGQSRNKNLHGVYLFYMELWL